MSWIKSINDIIATSLSPRPLASPSYPQSHSYPIMEIELHPAVSLLPETFSVLIAPVEMLAGALNSHLELQRYKNLIICGTTPASSIG